MFPSGLIKSTVAVLGCLTLTAIQADVGAQDQQLRETTVGSAVVPKSESSILVAQSERRARTERQREGEERRELRRREEQPDRERRARPEDREHSERERSEAHRERRPDSNSRQEGSDRDEDDLFHRFRPQTEREAQLFRMIEQLRREVSELRRLVHGRTGDERLREIPRGTRDLAEREPRRESQERRVPPAPRGWERTKEGKVFQAYDKNRDQKVTLEEWYAMKEGLTERDTQRRALEATRFRQADPNSDGKMTVAEFLFWYKVGRFRGVRREGGQRSEGPRDRVPRREEPRREAEPRRDGDPGPQERDLPRARSESGRKQP